MKYFLILAFYFSLSFSLALANVPIDVVFDIDQTIATLIHEGADGDLLSPSGKVVSIEFIKDKLKETEKYRVYEGFTELLQELKIKQEKGLVRISFYSGGLKERNLALLKKITLPDGSSASDISYKILSRDDMIATGRGENFRIRERFQKDLTKINPNLEDVVLLDDIKDFVPLQQQKNVLWLDEKFPYPERVGNSSIAPLDKNLIKLEQEKYSWIRTQLLESIDERLNKGISLVEIINKKTLSGKFTPLSPAKVNCPSRASILSTILQH